MKKLFPIIIVSFLLAQPIFGLAADSCQRRCLKEEGCSIDCEIPLPCLNECSYAGQTEKKCSGDYVQRRICGNYDSDPCLEWSSWSNWQDCGTDTWTDNYRCSGSWLQREKIKKGCLAASCYSYSQWESWQDCLAINQTCQDRQCLKVVYPQVDIKANGSDGPITLPYNTAASLSWTSSNADYCYASGAWSGTKSLNGSQSTDNLTSSKTYTLTCSGSGGSASDSVTINVSSASPSLYVSLSASPSSGCVPLTGIDLSANVSGTAQGPITYFFDCTNDGSWEKIYSSSGSYYTAYNLCNYSSIGTYTPKIKVEREGLYAENTSQINVYSCYSSPIVDIKANGSDGPITLPYNTAASLSWTSSNADYCYASGAWSGTKSLNGSQSTDNLTSSKTYTLTCSGSGGLVSDSVTVNVGPQVSADFSLKKTVRNLSRGTVFSDVISANPGDVLIVGIVVKAKNDFLSDIIIKETLPAGLIYRGELKLNDILISGDIFSGLNIGSLEPGQKKTVTFRLDVAGAESFGFGQTRLTNTVLVSSAGTSRSDIAEIIVSRAAVAGVATAVPTGLTNNIFFDSFFLPLLITLLIIWLLKTPILKLEKWLDERKKQYQEYKSKKLLDLKIARVKAEEFLKSKLF